MFYSVQKKQLQTLNRRTFFLLLGKLSLFSILGYRLFDIQITNSSKYKTLSKNNQINLEIIYPVRGIIKDRSGNLLASNIKVFDLYIIPEQTTDINQTLNKSLLHIDGNLVGSVVQDFQVVIMNGLNIIPEVSNTGISNLNSGTVINPFEIQVCEGTMTSSPGPTPINSSEETRLSLQPI